jgi:hypothetical protein
VFDAIAELNDAITGARTSNGSALRAEIKGVGRVGLEPTTGGL